MVVEVSVVVGAEATGSTAALLGSLDDQSLTTDRFEVVVLDRGLTPDQRGLVQRLAARRPNLRMVDPAQDWQADLAGVFVLGAQPQQRFFPEALERLTAFAEAHQLDVVLGRPVRPGLTPPATLLSDSPQLGEAEAPQVSASPVLLARRERLRPAGQQVEADQMDVDTQGARVGVLASYPSAYDPTPAPTSSPIGEGGSVSINPVRLDWRGHELVLTLTGTLVGTVLPDSAPVVVARQLGSQLSFLVPAEGDVSPADAAEPGTYAWQATATLSPLTGAAGDPLPRGLWEIDVLLAGVGVASAPAVVESSALSAVLPGLVVATGVGASGALQLDVGATRFPLITGVDPANGSVTESAHGSVLALALPSVHVQTAETVPATIGLGRLRLPAALETSTGTAVLTAFVSGLTGINAITAQVGGNAQHPTGVSLQILATGQMLVVATPPEPAVKKAAPPKKATPKKAAPPKKASPEKKANSAAPPAKLKSPAKKQRPAATGPVARLRRAVPMPLEPLARRLSHSPGARKVYRKLTGLVR